MKTFISSLIIITNSFLLINTCFDFNVFKSFAFAVYINGFIVGIHHLFNKEDKK